MEITLDFTHRTTIGGQHNYWEKAKFEDKELTASLFWNTRFTFVVMGIQSMCINLLKVNFKVSYILFPCSFQANIFPSFTPYFKFHAFGVYILYLKRGYEFQSISTRAMEMVITSRYACLTMKHIRSLMC